MTRPKDIIEPTEEQLEAPKNFAIRLAALVDTHFPVPQNVAKAQFTFYLLDERGSSNTWRLEISPENKAYDLSRIRIVGEEYGSSQEFCEEQYLLRLGETDSAVPFSAYPRTLRSNMEARGKAEKAFTAIFPKSPGQSQE